MLVVAWANLHGSFVLAPLVLAYVWLDDLVRARPSRPSFLVLVVGTLATAVTPFGPAVWAYAAGIGRSPVITQHVSEWQRTTPFTVPGLLFYASAAGALAVALRCRAALRWPDWLWLAGMFAIGAWTVRGLAWWPFGAAYALALALVSLRAMPDLAPSRVNAVIAAVLGIVLIAALPWWRPSDTLTGRVGLLSYAPSGLAAALREVVRPGDRVFVPQTWASWFEWAVPEASFFLDSRFELYPADVWTDYASVVDGDPSAAPTLEHWQVSDLVLPTGTAAPAGWTSVFEDADGAILVRANP